MSNHLLLSTTSFLLLAFLSFPFIVSHNSRYGRGIWEWTTGLKERHERIYTPHCGYVTKDNGLLESRNHWLALCHFVRVKDELYSGAVQIKELMGSTKARVLPFALLAMRRGVVPEGFSWDLFLSSVNFLFMTGFSGDMVETINHIGVEDVLARSLRLTAIDIYGNSPTEHGIYCDEYLGVWHDIMALGYDPESTGSLLMEVGGHEDWFPYFLSTTRRQTEEDNNTSDNNNNDSSPLDVLNID